MEWPFKKAYTKEAYLKQETKESEAQSKTAEIREALIKSVTRTQDFKLLGSDELGPIPTEYKENDLNNEKKRLAKAQQKLKDLYEKAHGDALKIEKEHQRLITEALDATEKLNKFETEQLGMHNDSKERQQAEK